jgi:hypothetical protein
MLRASVLHDDVLHGRAEVGEAADVIAPPAAYDDDVVELQTPKFRQFRDRQRRREDSILR